MQILVQQEAQRSSARKIRLLCGEVNNGSTTIVTIQDDKGNWVDLTNKLAIEEAIVLNNKAKFQQSFHTTFMQPPLCRIFGFKALTATSRSVLAGVYDPLSDIDDHVKTLLEDLYTPEAG